MTIDEAFHRVVRRHWLLILMCVLLAVLASLVRDSREPVQYQALGRVQMGTDLAASQVQADAMSERALGIATSPGVVKSALAKAKLDVDPKKFASTNITVQRVGVSPVLEIGVTSESPAVATTIASSITADVIRFSNEAGRDAAATRRTKLQAQISDLEKQREKLIPRLSTASPGEALALQATISGLMTTQTEYERQLSAIDLAASAQQQAVLLDPVRTPTTPLPRERPQQAALAGAIGLLLGLGLASVREAVRPSLRSPRVIAAALGAPHLGDVPGPDLDAPDTATAVSRAGDRLALLAKGRGVEKVFLVPALEQDDLLATLIAARIQPRDGHTAHRIRCSVLGIGWEDPGAHPAAVVLTRRQVSGRSLEQVMALLGPLGWPVLGFVTCVPGDVRSRRMRHVRMPRVAVPQPERESATATEDPAETAPAAKGSVSAP